ncbi:MAG: chemotaxis protein CheW [Candidatus Omnitrophica bacterium]|nr:chemotaxis protein CheW [Candidatus Omnitrophota bacterium]
MAEDKEKIIIEVDPGEYSEEMTERKKTVRVQVFSLGGEDYGMVIGQAKEVVFLPAVTRVPNVPDFIEGIINWHGEIIALIDLAYFFGLKAQRKVEEERVIITDAAGFPVGILVDKLRDTLDIEEGLIQAPLVTLDAKAASFTKGQVHLKDRILILLDMEKILNCQEIKTLRQGEK